MTLMHSLRTGLVSVRQKRARCGRSGGGLPRRVAAFRLAAAAAAASAAGLTTAPGVDGLGAPGVVGDAGVDITATVVVGVVVAVVGPFCVAILHLQHSTRKTARE